MVFLGFVVLSDPPKADVAETIHELGQLGVRLKIITGDNTLIAAHVAREVGLDNVRILSGYEMDKMSSQALMRRATEVDIFAEVEPTQKEDIIRALKKAGHVVGYIGDGINDAPALHAADVSLSVEGAADVAREAADFVLLEHDLEVLVDGVREGRRTFANTLKYVFIATSANFGNMFSMAGASLFLPFLPLLPKQILLINLLTDFPEMTIAGDNVDPELVEAPRRWDIGFHSAVYARVRSRQLGIRLPHLCGAGAAERDNRRISHRMVYRVDCLRRAHRAGCPKPTALLSEPAQSTPHVRHVCDRRHRPAGAPFAILHRIGLSIDAGAFLSDHRSRHWTLRCSRRGRKASVLSPWQELLGRRLNRHE